MRAKEASWEAASRRESLRLAGLHLVRIDLLQTSVRGPKLVLRPGKETGGRGIGDWGSALGLSVSKVLQSFKEAILSVARMRGGTVQVEGVLPLRRKFGEARPKTGFFRRVAVRTTGRVLDRALKKKELARVSAKKRWGQWAT